MKITFLPNNYEGGQFGVELTSLFWHFVDVIWIVLFILYLAIGWVYQLKILNFLQYQAA